MYSIYRDWECFNCLSLINKEIGKLAYYRGIVTDDNSAMITNEIKASLITFRKSHLVLISILR